MRIRGSRTAAAMSRPPSLEQSSMMISSWGERLWARTLLIEAATRSEEHTSELQSLMRISYAVFCLKKKKKTTTDKTKHIIKTEKQTMMTETHIIRQKHNKSV